MGGHELQVGGQAGKQAVGQAVVVIGKHLQATGVALVAGVALASGLGQVGAYGGQLVGSGMAGLARQQVAPRHVSLQPLLTSQRRDAGGDGVGPSRRESRPGKGKEHKQE